MLAAIAIAIAVTVLQPAATAGARAEAQMAPMAPQETAGETADEPTYARVG